MSVEIGTMSVDNRCSALTVTLIKAEDVGILWLMPFCCAAILMTVHCTIVSRQCASMLCWSFCHRHCAGNSFAMICCCSAAVLDLLCCKNRACSEMLRPCAVKDGTFAAVPVTTATCTARRSELPHSLPNRLGTCFQSATSRKYSNQQWNCVERLCNRQTCEKSHVQYVAHIPTLDVSVE